MPSLRVLIVDDVADDGVEVVESSSGLPKSRA